MKSAPQSINARIARRASNAHRRVGIVALIALASILLCGATAPEGCQSAAPPPSHTGAEVAGVTILAGAAVGTVVLVEVHHSNHTIEGCVIAGPTGLEVQDLKNNKSYMLAGATASTRVGDAVRLHGTKENLTRADRKRNPAADPTFVVQKVTRDFGPCKLAASPANAAE